ncbi:hypothetical protein WDW89_18545, partial [Deltaproteobacteria bacterium TL4]
VRKITVRNPVNGRVILVDEKTQTLHIESVIDGTVHQLSGLDPVFFEMMLPVFEDYAFTKQFLPAGTVLGLATMNPDASGIAGDPDASFLYEIATSYSSEQRANAVEYWAKGGPGATPASWDNALNIMVGGDSGVQAFEFRRASDENPNQVAGDIKIEIEKDIFAQAFYSPVKGTVYEIYQGSSTADNYIIIQANHDQTLHKISGLDLGKTPLALGKEVLAGQQIGWISQINFPFQQDAVLYYEIQMGSTLGGNQYASVRLDPSDYWETKKGDTYGHFNVELVPLFGSQELLAEGEETLFRARLSADVDQNIELSLQSKHVDTYFKGILATSNTIAVSIPKALPTYVMTDAGDSSAESAYFTVGVQTDLDFQSETSPLEVSLTGSNYMFDYQAEIVDSDAGLVKQVQGSLWESINQLSDSFTAGTTFSPNTSKLKFTELLGNLTRTMNGLKDALSATDPLGNPAPDANKINQLFVQWETFYKPEMFQFLEVVESKTQPISNSIYHYYDLENPEQLLRPLSQLRSSIDLMFTRAKEEVPGGEPFTPDLVVIQMIEAIEDQVETWNTLTENTIISSPSNIPNSAIPAPTTRWEAVMYHLLRPEAEGAMLPQTVYEFFNPTESGKLQGETGISYHQEFKGQAQVYLPVGGLIHHVTDGAVWLQLQDGTIHRFSNLETISDLLKTKFENYQQSHNDQDRVIQSGDELGLITSEQTLGYEIYGLGSSDTKASTWPKFDAQEYWNNGGLGLEVVTFDGSRGVSIEEGSQEQLTFRLKVGHTGEIKLKLRFNYEGTAEEDRVFAFYYETLGADGSRVQHYESELEVTFPATEADGSDQG